MAGTCELQFCDLFCAPPKHALTVHSQFMLHFKRNIFFHSLRSISNQLLELFLRQNVTCPAQNFKANLLKNQICTAHLCIVNQFFACLKDMLVQRIHPATAILPSNIKTLMNQPYESTIYGKTSIEHVDFTLVLEKQKNTKGVLL